MDDRIPRLTEDEERDLLPDRSAITDKGGAREALGDIAYPSDRHFVENVVAMRILSASILGSVWVFLGLVLVFVGSFQYAAFSLTLGGLALLYAVAMRQGWIRPRWWL